MISVRVYKIRCLHISTFLDTNKFYLAVDFEDGNCWWEAGPRGKLEIRLVIVTKWEERKARETETRAMVLDA